MTGTMINSPKKTIHKAGRYKKIPQNPMITL